MGSFNLFDQVCNIMSFTYREHECTCLWLLVLFKVDKQVSWIYVEIKRILFNLAKKDILKRQVRLEGQGAPTYCTEKEDISIETG